MKISAENRINVNAKEFYGKTAFHMACQNGKIRVFETIIKNAEHAKFDLMAKDKDQKIWCSQTD